MFSYYTCDEHSLIVIGKNDRVIIFSATKDSGFSSVRYISLSGRFDPAMSSSSVTLVQRARLTVPRTIW